MRGGYGAPGTLRGGNYAVRLTRVWVKYSGSGKPAIKNVTLALPKHCVALVTGPNGAGKTTLIETCLGLLKPYRGTAELLGINTKSRSVTNARKLCSYVPQDFMKPPHVTYSVKQVIAMGLTSAKAAFEPITKSEEARIAEVAGLLGIKDLLDEPIGKLSGGQQQRVLIARALVRNPQALFLDEPLSSIDADSRHRIAKVLRDYVDKAGAFAMIVSHDTSPVEPVADIIIELDNGVVKGVREK